MWPYIIGALVLVALLAIVLRGRGGGRDLVADGGRARAAVEPPSEARVVELAREGKKIQAIKMLRELRPMSLKDAKDWVDGLDGGRPAGRMPGPRTVGAASDEEILAVARAGNKIQAIKMAREAHGWGLKEAKDWVEGSI